MSERTTDPTSQTTPSDEPSTEDLSRAVARYDDRDQVHAAGYVFGGW